ncbi:MAG: DUF1109 domain-containing protein [Pseudomonadota bacterium]|nr:DUF1109 domain-containing protein [Pseudomonadota bacterium]
MNTSDLIATLAGNLKPVRRLRPPVVRAACWLMLAALVLALLTISQGIRPDLVERLHDRTFAVSIAASLLTGVLAAIAAFQLSLPDRSRLWLLLPLPALLVWLSNISYQCLVQWISIGPQGITLGEAAHCFATLALSGLPLSLALLVMLRYTAPLRPSAVALTAGLAVGGITATALSLFHVLDATVLILTWNLGTALLFVGLGGLFGRRIFQWVAPIPYAAARG